MSIASALILSAVMSCPPGCERGESGEMLDKCQCLDMDGSGNLTPHDIDVFLYGFFSPDGVPDAFCDIDCSGTVDPDDLADFLTAFYLVDAECDV